MARSLRALDAAQGDRVAEARTRQDCKEVMTLQEALAKPMQKLNEIREQKIAEYIDAALDDGLTRDEVVESLKAMRPAQADCMGEGSEGSLDTGRSQTPKWRRVQ
ncbi:MAG TPA: hypothetical protein VNJ02_17765 [Vicinamibacterales bacterium]|nr:hypothetical protein [Vicinamibacterales bacterium]